MGSVLKDYPNDSFQEVSLPTNFELIHPNRPSEGVYCYTNNGINYSYPVVSQSSSQYNLWKVPADL